MNRTEHWHLATTWVKSHPVLIRCIASPYYRYMSCDISDLESEAVLVAYQVLQELSSKKKGFRQMERYFQVVFRTRCMALASGVRCADIDLDRLPAPAREDCRDTLDQDLIENALQLLTRRQRQVVGWILHQPRPVNTGMIGKRFGVSYQAVQAILKNAIQRIENGHRGIREELSAAA